MRERRIRQCGEEMIAAARQGDRLTASARYQELVEGGYAARADEYANLALAGPVSLLKLGENAVRPVQLPDAPEWAVIAQREGREAYEVAKRNWNLLRDAGLDPRTLQPLSGPPAADGAPSRASHSPSRAATASVPLDLDLPPVDF